MEGLRSLPNAIPLQNEIDKSSSVSEGGHRDHCKDVESGSCVGAGEGAGGGSRSSEAFGPFSALFAFDLQLDLLRHKV